MSTPIKRKRGHVKRHPWSNAAPKLNPEPFNDDDCARWHEYSKFRVSDEGVRLSNMAKPAVIYSCFMAGYLAGKGAK